MKKWAVWKTVVVTIFAVIFIAGATVGGILLSNGMGGQTIMPEDITFVLDENLYNSDTSQFEVTDNFKLTITSSTTNVTETQVRLSFTGTTPPPSADGTITDGIITVPEYVYINQPFDVILNRSVLIKNGVQVIDNNGAPVTSPNGGISHLRARSANIQKLPENIDIAVDVPVHSIDVEICDMEGNVVSKVTEGDNFYARANFFPMASRYLYSDESREKLTYFEPVGSTEVNFQYDETFGGYFVAGNAREGNQIIGYTFKNANTQEQILEEYSQNASGKELYDTVLSYLSSSSDKSVSNKANPANVDITVATISSFEVIKAGRYLQDMTAMKRYTLTVQEGSQANDFLGVKIGSNGQSTSLLKNVALMFEYKVQDSYRIAHSEIISVRGGNSVVVDVDTYYLPSPVGNPNWTFYTTGAYNFRITVVLLERDGDGYKLYSENEQPIKATVYLDSKTQQEQDVRWKNAEEDILITLDFDGDDVIPTTKSLEGLVDIPEENIFRTGFYFAYFPTGKVEDVLDAKCYDPERSGEYRIGTQSYYLYVLKGSELAVRGTGEFELFFATIQRNEFDEFNIDANGRYVLAQPTLTSKQVNVTKTLYQGSVEDLVITSNNTTGFIYEGSDETIVLTFTIKADSWEVFKEQLNTDQIHLNLLSLAGDSITDKFTFDYEIVEANRQVVYTLNVNSSLNLTADLQIGDVVLSDDFSKISWSFISDSDIKIYTPVVETIEFTSDSVDLNRDVTVNQQITADSTFKTIITHYLKDGTTTTIDTDNAIEIFINKLLVRVIDQHGNSNIFASRWSFATNNPNVITVNNRTFTFKTADNANATIYVQCENKNSDAINFVVTSTGIQSIKKDNSREIKAVIPNDDYVTNASTSSVSVEKYGAKGKTLNPNTLIKLYTDQNATNELSSGYKFVFNSAYLYSLSDEVLMNIFGGDGMVYINRTSNTESDKGILSELPSGYTANELRTLLALLGAGQGNEGITNIYIRNDFASYHELGLQIVSSNNSGAINISLDLLLQTNVTVEADAEIETYAGFMQEAKGNLSYKDGSGTLAERLSAFNGYYMVRGGNGYVLSNADNAESISVGKIANGKFLFNDFYNVEQNNYSVTIYLDSVENPFALTYNVNFTVKRNVKIEYNDKTYSILTSADALSNYFTISRVKEGSEALTFTPRITLAKGESSNLRLNGNGFDATVRINEANPPFFGYNVEALSEGIVFELAIAGSTNYDEVARLTLKYDLGERYSYASLANQIYYKVENADGTITNINPTVQTVDGINYLLVQKDYNWKFNNTIENTAYLFNIMKYYIDASGQRVPETGKLAYDVPGGNTISFENINEAIRGLGDSTIYLIVEIHNGADRKQGTMLIPLLVSNIGLDFVSYTDTEFNTLANALAKPDDLIANDVYEELLAGSDYEIANPMMFTDTLAKDVEGNLVKSQFKGFIFPEDSGFTTSISFVPTSQGYYDTLVKNIYQDEESKIWHIDINHLSQAIDTAYIALQFEISNGTFVQDFYYVIKVLPDTKVNSALYAFDSGREEISGTAGSVIGGENGIDLSEKFSNQTLHAGAERFSVVVYDKDGNPTTIGDSLKFSYRVVSLTKDNQTYTDKADYSRFLNVEFREVNGHINMLATPTREAGNAIMTLEIRRVYDGGSRGDTRQVIGGEIDYKFVINSTMNYSLSYTGDNVTVDGNNASVTLNSSNANLEMDVQLVSTVNSTDSFVYEVLQINGYSDEGEVKTIIENSDGEKVVVESENPILTAKYISKRDAKIAKLILTRGGYLEKDMTAYITFYTDYGYLGTLTINLTASAEIDCVAEVKAGSTYNFKSDLVKELTLNGVTANDYTIVSAVASDTQEDYNLFEFVNNSDFKIYSSIKDATINVSITLAINGVDEDGNTVTYPYEFVMPLKVSANIKQTDGEKVVGTSENTAERIERKDSVIAQNNLALTTEELISFGKNGNDIIHIAPSNFDVRYSWRAISGSDYIVEATNQTIPVIHTKDVNKNGATVVVLLTLHLKRGDLTYQELCVRYTFNISPNTEIYVSYPEPTRTIMTYKYFEYRVGDDVYYLNADDGKNISSESTFGYEFAVGTVYYSDNTFETVAGSLKTSIIGTNLLTYTPQTRGEDFDADYFKNGTAFASAKENFFNGNATFGGKRLALVSVEGSTVGTDYKVTLSAKNNITITTSDRGEIKLEDGSNILVDDTASEPIDVKDLTFVIGEYNENGELVNDGTDSYAIFLIESNGVTETYKIVLQDNVLSLMINQENSEGTNNLETFYVDNVLSNNIFADGRIIELEISSDNAVESIINANYRLIFTKVESEGSITYKYRDVKMSSADIGKTLYFDVGESILGYNYVGTYHNNSGSFTINNDGDLIGISDTAVKVEDEDLYARIPTLVSRVRLTYVGSRVNYDYTNTGLEFVSDYDSSQNHRIADYFTEQSAEEIRKIVKLSNFEFTFDNGANVITTTFSTVYNYTTDLDIAVEYSGLNSTSVIYVNQEITSVIGNNKVYHPSTRDILTSDEIKIRDIDLDLQVVGVRKPVDTVANMSEYMAKFAGIEKPYYNTTDRPYLGISTSQENLPDIPLSQRKVLDYRVTGFGADNDGSYVLLCLTYTVRRGAGDTTQTYTKEFYLVYQVLSDYQLVYNNTTNIDIDDNGVKSNLSYPYPLYATSDKYNFNVAGAGNGVNIVSVKHSRSTTSDKEVAASGFTYTLTFDENVQGYSYNIRQNVSSKLNSNLTASGSLWTIDSIGSQWTWANPNDNAALSFVDVQQVVFGSQRYRLKAVDSYGYTFYVYFILNSGGETPTALEEGSFSITENYKFDIAAQYERLDIIGSGSGNDKVVDISPAKESNSNGADFRVLNIANLEAWGFDQNLNIEQSGTTAIETYFNPNTTNGGYSVKSNVELQESKDLDYLQIPKFVNTTVNHIAWYDNGKFLAEITTANEGSAEARPLNENLATKSDLVFNGIEASFYRNIEGRYRMPKLPGEIYGASESKEIVMIITLTYSRGGNVEVFDLPVRMTVNRDYANAGRTNNVVRDGVEFNIEDYIDSTSTTEGGSVPTEYFDDTLKITLPGTSQIRYTVENLDSGIIVDNVASNEDYDYTRTEMVSISGLFNQTLHAGDRLKFTVTEFGSAEVQNTPYTGYYVDYAGNVIHGGEGGSQELEFAISNMNGKDKINIPMAKQLYRGPVNVRKYYLARTYGSDTYTYQISQQYTVTNYYYSMSTNYSDSYYQVDRYLIANDVMGDGENQYIIPRAGWTYNMTLNIGQRTDGGIVAVNYDSFSASSNGYIYYEITNEVSSGAADIDTNSGQITTNSAFNISTHYINVAIYVKVSGIDGQFRNKDSQFDQCLGTVRFMLKQPMFAFGGDSLVYTYTDGAVSSVGSISSVLIDSDKFVDNKLMIDMPTFNANANRIEVEGVTFLRQNVGNNVYYIRLADVIGGEANPTWFVNNLPLLELDNVNNNTITVDTVGYNNGKEAIHNFEDLAIPTTGTVYSTMSKAVAGAGEEFILGENSFIGFNGVEFITDENNLRKEVAFNSDVQLYLFNEDSGEFTLAENEEGEGLTIGSEFADQLINGQYRIDKTIFDRPIEENNLNKKQGLFGEETITGYRIVNSHGDVYFLNITDVSNIIGIATRKTELQFVDKIAEGEGFTLNTQNGLNFYAYADSDFMYVPLSDYGVTFKSVVAHA